MIAESAIREALAAPTEREREIIRCRQARNDAMKAYEDATARSDTRAIHAAWAVLKAAQTALIRAEAA